MDVFCKHYAVSFLSFSSVCKGQFLTGINFFKQSYIVLVNLQEVAGGKKFLELLLEAINFTSYCLIRITLTMAASIVARMLQDPVVFLKWWHYSPGKSHDCQVDSN